MKKTPSASGLTRALACPLSHVLPWASAESAAASLGTEGHAYVLEHRDLARLSPEARDLCEQIDLSLVQVGEVEVAWEYDPAADTSVHLGRLGGHRGYPRRPGRLYGTSDTYRVVDGVLYLDDLKFDFGPDSSAPAPRDNGQLHGLALFACRALGLSRAVVNLCHINGHNGYVRYDDPHALDEFALMGVAAKIYEAIERIDAADLRLQRGEQPDAHEGPWCRYCPAAHVCHAKVAAIRAAASGTLQVLPDDDGALTPEHAAAALEAVQRIERDLRGIKARLREYAERNGGIPLGEGRAWGPHPVVEERVHANVAWRHVDALLGKRAAGELLPGFVSKTALNRVVKAAKDRDELPAESGKAPTQKALVDRLVGLISADGGLERVTGVECGDYARP